MARDGGNTSRSVFVSVSVSVTDINDNVPVFSEDTYSVSVVEKSAPGDVLQLQVGPCLLCSSGCNCVGVYVYCKYMYSCIFLFLLCCSAKPLLGPHALVWMVGFRMAGFMLSGSGIRVFVLGNMGLGWVDGEKYQSIMGEGRGVEGDMGGGVYCLLEVPEGCNCQVNVLQCTLEGVETVVGKYIRRKSVPLFVERSCICSSCGKLIFVCICVGGWILFGCVRA